MKLTIMAKEITDLHWKTELEYLVANGFNKDFNILRLEFRDEDDNHLKYVEFEQDNTPTIGGDNIECEYLKMLSNS